MSNLEKRETEDFEELRGSLSSLSGSSRSRLEQFTDFFAEESDGAGLEVFMSEFERMSSSRRSLLLFIVVAGYYPPEQVFRRVEAIATEFGWASSVDWILSCNALSENEVEFVRGGIAYDVTNTLISPVLTGIQRVVYELGRGIWKTQRTIRFFSVKAGIGPTLLSGEHEKAFLEKYRPSSRPLTEGEADFNPYDLLEAASHARPVSRAGSIKLALRSKAKSFYEFSKVYLFPPAMTVGVGSTLARFRAYQQRKREEAMIPKVENKGEATRGGLRSLGSKGGRGKSRSATVVWFEDCNLLVAELFSPMRSDLYPSILAAFKSTTMLIHDVIPITHPQYCVDTVVAAHVGYLRVTSMFDRVVPVSHSTGESYSEFARPTYGMDQRVEPMLLPNFLGELPPRKLAEGKLPRICCFSTMEPRKGHWRVVEACERLWDEGAEFELVLIGGSGWKSEELVERIEYLRRKGRPILRNRRFLDDHEVGMLMRTCLCSVFCSEVEGFGLPVVESLALGVPVICSNLSSMAEIIEKTEGCFPVDPFSIESIGAAISKFIDGRESVSEQPAISLAGLHSVEEWIEELARFPGK